MQAKGHDSPDQFIHDLRQRPAPETGVVKINFFLRRLILHPVVGIVGHPVKPGVPVVFVPAAAVHIPRQHTPCKLAQMGACADQPRSILLLLDERIDRKPYPIGIPFSDTHLFILQMAEAIFHIPQYQWLEP